MSSLANIFTTLQNGVNAINNLAQTALLLAGTNTSATVTTGTLIVTGRGRLVSYSVTVPGTAGFIHDASTVATAAATNALCTTPEYPGFTADSPLVPTGVFQCGQTFQNGLVIVPGTGQSVNVTYSLFPTTTQAGG